VRSLTSELQQVLHSLGSPAAASNTGSNGRSQPGPGQAADEDDVIDADFTVS
jgi:hypothetical protein